MTSTLTKHTALVTSPSGLTDFVPNRVDVTVDESWSPYVQATIEVPTASFTEALDPRENDRLRIRLEQAFGDLVALWELAADFGGSVAALTAVYGGKPLAAITRAYSQPWNRFSGADPLSFLTAAFGGSIAQLTAAFGNKPLSAITAFLHSTNPTFHPRPSTVFDADLGIRSIKKRHRTGLTTIRLSSDEALLQDYGHTSTTAYTPTTSDLRQLVNVVLAKIGATLEPGTATGTFATTAQWIVGQSAWEFINPLVQKAGLVLYCDEARRWHLVTAAATAGDLALSDSENVTDLDADLDRSTDWFDAAVIEYAWTEAGVSRKEYDIYAPAGYVKLKKFTYQDTPFPGVGAAAALVARAKTRGFTYQVSAVSNYDARPRQHLTVDIVGEATKQAIVSSIRWAQPGNTMTVEMRDLTEIE